MLEWAIDAVIGVGMVWLAWKALSGEDLYRSVILFIAFGLVLAMAWVRLEAPDIALAEAAIGAGLTGALLLDTVAQLSKRNGRSRSESPLPTRTQSADAAEGMSTATERRRWAVAVPFMTTPLVLTLGLFVAAGIATVSAAPGGLTRPAAEALELSGVSHGVTAVLLNYRAFDTLLEIGVLLAAVLAMLVVRRSTDLRDAAQEPAGEPVMTGAAMIVIPLMVLVSGFLLWLGTHAPGGAFQAGAVLASAGVLLYLAGFRSVSGVGPTSLALLLSAGFAVFVLVAIATLLSGREMLELPPERAGAVIVLVETVLAISIAATLAALFVGGRPTALDHPRTNAEPPARDRT
jgi:uncharacterized MnhB-related membrane protein